MDRETVIATDRHSLIKLAEGTLSDGSKVYAVSIGNVRIDCVRKDAAVDLFTDLTRAGVFDVSLEVQGDGRLTEIHSASRDHYGSQFTV